MIEYLALAFGLALFLCFVFLPNILISLSTQFGRVKPVKKENKNEHV